MDFKPELDVNKFLDNLVGFGNNNGVINKKENDCPNNKSSSSSSDSESDSDSSSNSDSKYCKKNTKTSSRSSEKTEIKRISSRQDEGSRSPKTHISRSPETKSRRSKSGSCNSLSQNRKKSFSPKGRCSNSPNNTRSFSTKGRKSFSPKRRISKSPVGRSSLTPNRSLNRSPTRKYLSRRSSFSPNQRKSVERRRSRSRSVRKSHSRSRSRHRSRSRSRGRYSYGRRYSRSPRRVIRSRGSRYNRSRSKERRPRSRSRSPHSSEGARLHIADLDIGVEKRHLERVFEKYGKLKEIWMAQNPPCFAFVVYYSQMDANLAMRECNGTIVGPCKIRVTRAQPRVRGGNKYRSYDPNLRCYQCGQTGHFSRNCNETKLGYKRPPTPVRYYSRSPSRDRRMKGSSRSPYSRRTRRSYTPRSRSRERRYRSRS